MKKQSIFTKVIFFLYCIQVGLYNYPLDTKEIDRVHQKTDSSQSDQSVDLDDEKLFQEIVDIFSSSYKNMVDIAAIYFCGFSVNKDTLYEQFFINLGRDMFHVIKLFSWYLPVMLKNPKLKKKEKIKKSIYVITTAAVFSYIISEILRKNSSSNLLTSNLLLSKRKISFDSADNGLHPDNLFKPRVRPKIES